MKHHHRENPLVVNRNWAEKAKEEKNKTKRRKAPAGREIRATAVRQRKPGHVFRKQSHGEVRGRLLTQQ